MDKHLLDDLMRNHEAMGRCVSIYSRAAEALQELQRKAAAFDWLCANLPAVDYWAVMMTGQHDPLRAVEQAKREDERLEEKYAPGAY